MFIIEQWSYSLYDKQQRKQRLEINACPGTGKRNGIGRTGCPHHNYAKYPAEISRQIF